MDKIGLCMIAPEFLPTWGGTGSYVVELLKYLPKEVEVHVVTLSRRNLEMSTRNSLSNDPEHICGREMNIHYVSSAKETFFYNLGFQIACFREIQRLHREYNFDIVHSQFGHMSDVFLQLFKKICIPTVTTVHGTIALLKEVSHQYGLSFGDLEWSEKQLILFYPALRTMELLYANHISKFIAVSNVAKSRILTDLRVKPTKVCTIYNGVDTELFCVPSQDEVEKRWLAPTVVYVGRMLAKKGIHILIRAMPKILNKKPDTRFLFVGGGNLDLYQGMIKKMGIPNKNFAFIGHVDYFERQKILSQATIFVNPSFFELCSLSILEAMSCALSVVATNVGGNPEIIESGKNGVLVPIGNSQRLAEAVTSLLEDENHGRRLGEAARKTVERSFTAERTARKTYDTYREVLGQ